MVTVWMIEMMMVLENMHLKTIYMVCVLFVLSDYSSSAAILIMMSSQRGFHKSWIFLDVMREMPFYQYDIFINRKKMPLVVI